MQKEWSSSTIDPDDDVKVSIGYTGFTCTPSPCAGGNGQRKLQLAANDRSVNLNVNVEYTATVRQAEDFYGSMTANPLERETLETLYRAAFEQEIT